jgi:hypothetical protein
MGTEYFNVRQTAFASGVLMLASLSLGGCATSASSSSMMDSHAAIPAPPKTGVYLPVEVLPPNREEPTMTADEQSKLKKTLIAAREGQAKEKAKEDAFTCGACEALTKASFTCVGLYSA